MNRNCIFGLIAAVMTGCNGTPDTTTFTDNDSTQMKETETTELTPCDITVGNIKFTLAKNQSEGTIDVAGDTLTFTAAPRTDFFRSPDGSVVNNSPVIFTEIDNTKPFTLTAKVNPQFTSTGTYSAGVIYIYENDLHCQKMCFEQDEYGHHRVVTVRTIGTSDDNNHQAIPGDAVYMRISSDGTSLGSYYSIDGKEWHMARLYKNDFPEKILVGLSSQSPVANGHTCRFSDIGLVDRATADLRNGRLADD